jgi:hypothetical protein
LAGDAMRVELITSRQLRITIIIDDGLLGYIKKQSDKKPPNRCFFPFKLLRGFCTEWVKADKYNGADMPDCSLEYS